jgi:hypothetical protein
VLFSLVVSLVYDVQNQNLIFYFGFAEDGLYVLNQAPALDIIIEVLWFKLTAPATKYKPCICFRIDHSAGQDSTLRLSRSSQSRPSNEYKLVFYV